MRILYVCADFGIPVLGQKGAAVHVRELVSALARADHKVVVTAPVKTKGPWEQPAALHAELLTFEAEQESATAVKRVESFTRSLGVSLSLPGELRRILYDRQLAKDLIRRFRSAPPDVIYERASSYSTVGAEVAGALGVPLLVEVNAPLALEEAAYRGSELAKLALAAETRTLSQADAVLAVSTPLREYVVSLGADERRVHVVPNGVDPRIFRPGARDPALAARFGLNGGPVLGFVGGLRPWHGLESLPELLERLVARHPNACLLVVGDGPLRPALQHELTARGLTRNAVFTGSLPHEEIAPLIRHFDAALAPYPAPTEHAFYFSPLKVFEYMACAAPVVGPDVGQIAEVVCDGETGLLYPPGDVGALATACERLLGDPRLGQRIGHAAADHIRSRYTWDRNAARVAALAERLTAAVQP